ncbi:MAG: hypothetical protein ABIK64_07550, partial [Bacillota bacterium]
MQLVATVLLLLLPGALAAHLHRRLKGQPASLKQLGVFAVYALILDSLLCGFKLLRGAAMANFPDWFSPPL